MTDRWEQVDWLQDNYAIADELGVAYNTVVSQRAKRKLQHLTPAARKATATREKVRELRAQGLTGNEIAGVTGLHEGHVHRLLRQMGLGRGSAAFHGAGWAVDWSSKGIDWRKGDRELAKELGVHYTTVNRQRRKRAKRGR